MGSTMTMKAIKVLLVVGTSLIHSIIGQHQDNESKDTTASQIALSPNATECIIPRPELSSRSLIPTWQASFPGSGSRMTYTLISALTGLRTGDDYDSHGFGFDRVAVVKTHFPAKYTRGTFLEADMMFVRGIVILRNPRDAIPSLFNLLYERQNHLPNHSTRGPDSEWIKYRNDPGGFDFQIKMYETFVSFWMEKFQFNRNNLLLLSYEELTKEETGPNAAMRLSDFLREVEGIQLIDRELIPCIWHKIVKYKEKGGPSTSSVKNVRTMKRAKHLSMREGPKQRSYTLTQLEQMIGVLQRLMDKYRDDEEFTTIVKAYLDELSTTIPEELVIADPEE